MTLTRHGYPSSESWVRGVIRGGFFFLTNMAIRGRTKKSFIGLVSGRLTVIAEVESKDIPGKKIERRILCQCECGVEKIFRVHRVFHGKKNNRSQSCGCFKLDCQRTHGLSHTLTYRSWWSMVCRGRGTNQAF